MEKLTTFYGNVSVEVQWTTLAVTTGQGAQGVIFAVTNPSAQVLLVDGEAYGAVQFHAHGPSEHRLGTPRAGELHIVHQHLDDLAAGRPLQKSRLAVLGVFLEEGDASGPHPAMQISRALRDLSEGKPTDPTEVNYTLDDLLPPDRTARRYAGSLTTGGCEEVVTWIVFETSDTVPAPIYAHLEPPRPLQEPNRRYAVRGRVNLHSAAP